MSIKQTLALSEMAVCVAEGAILPLQSEQGEQGSIQHTSEAGGLLEVQASDMSRTLGRL